MSKDRYSALLMANMAARVYRRTPDSSSLSISTEALLLVVIKLKKDEKMYTGPSGLKKT